MSRKVENYHLKIWKNYHEETLLCSFQSYNFQSGISIRIGGTGVHNFGRISKKRGGNKVAYWFLLLIKRRWFRVLACSNPAEPLPLSIPFNIVKIQGNWKNFDVYWFSGGWRRESNPIFVLSIFELIRINISYHVSNFFSMLILLRGRKESWWGKIKKESRYSNLVSSN